MRTGPGATGRRAGGDGVRVEEGVRSGKVDCTEMRWASVGARHGEWEPSRDGARRGEREPPKDGPLELGHVCVDICVRAVSTVDCVRADT